MGKSLGNIPLAGIPPDRSDWAIVTFDTLKSFQVSFQRFELGDKDFADLSSCAPRFE